MAGAEPGEETKAETVNSWVAQGEVPNVAEEAVEMEGKVLEEQTKLQDELRKQAKEELQDVLKKQAKEEMLGFLTDAKEDSSNELKKQFGLPVGSTRLEVDVYEDFTLSVSSKQMRHVIGKLKGGREIAADEVNGVVEPKDDDDIMMPVDRPCGTPKQISQPVKQTYIPRRDKTRPRGDIIWPWDVAYVLASPIL